MPKLRIRLRWSRTVTKHAQNKGKAKKKHPHIGASRAVDTDAILNRLKVGILEYFSKSLPTGIGDAHRFILLANGHIWIPIAVESVIKKRELTCHVLRYASFNGDFHYKTLAVFVLEISTSRCRTSPRRLNIIPWA
jgi:hypothetical protein